MFIGHFAAGLAAKRIAPGASLGALTAAALFPDLLYPAFLLLGWEQLRVVPGKIGPAALEFVSYPFSHSLAATGVWSAALGLAYLLATRYRRGACVVSLAVLSHWFLDALSHRPDMPLYPGGPVVGLGLWNSTPATMIVEGSLFLAAVWVYGAATRARDRVGRWAFGALVALLGILSWQGFVGPPPPTEGAFAWAGLLGGLFPLWAWWIDRHRTSARR